MKPSRFTYHAPTELADALALLAEFGEDAKVLAGGQSLVPMLNLRLVSPPHIIDINRIAGLSDAHRAGESWVIPALARQAGVERQVDMCTSFPLLAQAVRHVASPQVRVRGTVCGSVAHADAAAELPAVMVALNATCVAVSESGIRQVPADEFFEFHLTTALAPNELLREVRLPEPRSNTRASFQKFALQRGDFALAAVATTATVRDGVVEDCRLVVSGVAPVPLRLEQAEGALRGAELTAEVARQVESIVCREIAPTDDIHARSDYRRRITGVLARRGVLEILGGTAGEEHDYG